jgi:hypothetical protein
MNTEVMSVQREKGVLEAWLSDQRAIILDSKPALSGDIGVS